MDPNYPSLEMTPFTGRSMRNIEPDEEQQSGPPNLRMAAGEGSCAECQHFDGENCTKYGDTPVEEANVCDGFEA